MRKLALTLLVCGAGGRSPSRPVAQDEPPAHASTIMSAPSPANAPTRRRPRSRRARDRAGPRLTATRGFSLSTPDAGARRAGPRRGAAHAAPAPRGRPPRRAAPRRPPPGPARQSEAQLRDRLGQADRRRRERAGAGLRPVAAAAAARQHALPDRGPYRLRRQPRDATSTLSQRRAQSVADFLVAMGVAAQPARRARLRPRPAAARHPRQRRREPARGGGPDLLGADRTPRRAIQLRQLHRLRRVEPRVAMGVIAVGEVGLGEPGLAARAFGDVAAGHLDMEPAARAPRRSRRSASSSAKISSSGRVLVPRGGAQGVAVHRIAGPEHRPARRRHRVEQRRQRCRRSAPRPSARSG